MQLFLEALDVWLFRDGRPFDAGSDHRAESLFPPFPSVIQGAIRSHHLVVKGINLHSPRAIQAAVGDAGDVRDLRLRGPFLARRARRPDGSERFVRYLPQPADAVTVNEARFKPASAPKAPDGGLITNITSATRTTPAPAPMLLGLDDDPKKGESGLWLDEDALHAYLNDGRNEVQGVRAATLFERESRFGIGIEPGNRVTKEGALYEAEFIRPARGTGLLVEVEGYDGWPEQGVLRIGGEARAAMFSQVEIASWPATPAPLPPRFRVYFATPAYFDRGWQPAGGDWSRFFEGEVRLVAAAVGRYESVGGHDMTKRGADAHKPARRYVPAGSVYYFTAGSGARVRQSLPQGAITDSTSADFEAKVGFGQVIFGRW